MRMVSSLMVALLPVFGDGLADRLSPSGHSSQSHVPVFGDPRPPTQDCPAKGNFLAWIGFLLVPSSPQSNIYIS